MTVTSNTKENLQRLKWNLLNQKQNNGLKKIKEVYVVPSAPHLLPTLRNWMKRLSDTTSGIISVRESLASFASKKFAT
jgi:hypothetical protein